MSDQRERLPDWTRRNVLVTSGVLGASALAGCTDGTDETTDLCGSNDFDVPKDREISDDNIELHEEWREDSLGSTSNPEWVISNDANSHTVSLEDGWALEMSGSGNASSAVRTQKDYDGWEGLWEVTGRFTIQSLSGIVVHQVRISDGGREPPIKLPLADVDWISEDGPSDGGDTYSFDFELSGEVISGSETDNVTLNLGQTYDYKLEHTGDGEYEAKIDRLAGGNVAFIQANKDVDADEIPPLSGQHKPKLYLDTNTNGGEGRVTHDEIQYNGAEGDVAIDTWGFSQSEVTGDGNVRSDKFYGYGQGMTVKHLETKDYTMEEDSTGDDEATVYRMEVASQFTSRRGNDNTVPEGEVPDGCTLEQDNLFRRHEIYVAGETNPWYLELVGSDTNEYLGFKPVAESSLGVGGTILEHSIKYGLGRLPFMGEVVALEGLASDLQSEMGPGEDSDTDDPVHFKHDTWRWHNLPESHFCRFDVKVEDEGGEAVGVTIRDFVHTSGVGSEFGTEVTFEFEPNGGGVTQKGEPTRIWDPPE